jgi:hypothetical protein
MFAAVYANAASVYFDTNTLSQVYDGTTKYVTATTFPSGLTLSMTYSGDTNAPVNAGFYQAIATVTQPGYEGAATGMLYVARAEPVIEFTPASSAVATSTVVLSASADSEMAPYYSVVSGPGSITGSNLTFTAGGTSVVVQACVEGNLNWNEGCAQATVQVSYAEMTIHLYNLTNEYTRNSQSPDAVTVPLGMEVSYAYPGISNSPVDVGDYTVVASSANGRWQGSVTSVLTITKATPVIYLFNPGCVNRTTNVLLYAVSQSLAPITNYLVESGPGEIYVSNSTHYLRFSGAGEVALVSAEAASSNWLATAVTNYIVAFGDEPLALSISNLNAVYDGTGHAADVYWPEGSGLTSNDIRVLYNGSTSTPVNAGSYEVLAYSTNGTAAGAQRTMFIDKAEDTVSGYNLPTSLAYDEVFGLSATSLSGNACLFVGSDTDRATIHDGTNLTTLGVGQVLIRAYTEESVNWNAAYNDRILTVVPANAVVGIDTGGLYAVYDGSSHAASGWTSPTNLSLIFTYNGSTAVPVDAGEYTVRAAVNHASYTGMTENIMTIARAVPTVEFPDPGPQITTSSVALSATSSGDGDVVYSVVTGPGVVVYGDQLYFSGAGTVSVAAVFAQTTNWAPATVTNSLTVTKAITSVTLAPLLQASNGSPCVVNGESIGESVGVTYDGSTNAPYATGTYVVVGTVSDVIYQGSITGELLVIDSPQLTFDANTNQAALFTVTWLSMTNLAYTLERADSPTSVWDALPPYTNMPGNGTWQSISIGDTNHARYYRLDMQKQQP